MHKSNPNFRKYIRIPSVLPAQIIITDADKNVVWKTSFQGFTRDINQAGVCLEINNFDDNLAERILQDRYLFSLSIDLPNLEESVEVYAKPCWLEKVITEDSKYSNKYKIGVAFLDIKEHYSQKIIKYAYKLHRRPKQIFGLICFFILLIGISFFYQMKFWMLNNKLTKELAVIKQQKDKINFEIIKTQKIKADLFAKLEQANQEIEQLSEFMSSGAETAEAMATPSVTSVKTTAAVPIVVKTSTPSVITPKTVANSQNVVAAKPVSASLPVSVKIVPTALPVKVIPAATPVKNIVTAALQKAQISVPEVAAKLEQLKSDREDLKKKLQEVVKKEEVLVQKKESIKEIDKSLSERKSELMYNWIKNNQSPSTGLVKSYDGDSELEDFAFTYDQALCVCNFVDRGDHENAKKIIDFFVFKARKHQGGFLNAYNVNSGYVMEWTTHAGPNAWIGMAMLKYIEKTKNNDYVKYVYPIAEYLLSLQDDEGGIRGGEDLTWYSTEHNLDCYSFFRMMYSLTNNFKYKIASDKILDWIKKTVYVKSENRLWRGKNDSKIATDTVSFCVPAIGPKLLFANDIDPEKLIQYVEKMTKVSTIFTNNKGVVFTITGFDYTDPNKIGRKGVISSEWTAQMVTTYQVMAEYFKTRDTKKFEYYNERAEFYNNELEKMLISLSPGKQNTAGIPYSTAHVDTGHGWLTPKSPYAISIAGTAYTLLSRYKTNPFSLQKEKDKYYL